MHSEIGFAGGALRISLTPAMTLIDIDGDLPPAELARTGAEAAGAAIRRLDITGSIGIDLPTMGSKAERQNAAEALDAALPPPFERTAINRSEEHTSELQSLMRISYAVFCLKKKTKKIQAH